MHAVGGNLRYDYGETHWHHVEEKDEAPITGGEFNLVSGSKNALIAADMKKSPQLAETLRDLGIKTVESSQGSASQKIPVSATILYLVFPLYAVKCGLNIYDDVESSQDVKDTFGLHIADAIKIDCQFREGWLLQYEHETMDS